MSRSVHAEQRLLVTRYLRRWQCFRVFVMVLGIVLAALPPLIPTRSEAHVVYDRRTLRHTTDSDAAAVDADDLPA